MISVQAIVTSIELRNPTESQPIEIIQFIFQSASKSMPFDRWLVAFALTYRNIALLGRYMASSFVASSDGHSGTLISEAAHALSQTALLTQPHATG